MIQSLSTRDINKPLLTLEVENIVSLFYLHAPPPMGGCPASRYAHVYAACLLQSLRRHHRLPDNNQETSRDTVGRTPEPHGGPGPPEDMRDADRSEDLDMGVSIFTGGGGSGGG